MDRLIYTAMTAMNAAMDRQRVVANNLANASTPGFRQEVFAVTPATLKDGSLEARAMARGNVRGADMKAARVVPTGNPLDVALEGKALIAFQSPDRQGEIYSRRGDLRVAASGVLENGEGLAVLGEGGTPITVPPGFAVSLAADGTVLASDPATPNAAAEAIDRIRLVNPEGSPLAKGIDSFLKVPNGGVLPPDPTARLKPGALEMSNVETADTLVQMIEAQRAFEQRARIIMTAGELDEAGSGLMALR
ncbi:flagellar basal body rod protein FlgF [Porphyrobacter sp. CACIAM 03H1]|uniref:flagellar basal body rod protein FlgF n=1 Tax=Porphyrobacter sp. CACIAM 03H1 TaxID=2003315 RepID=UPI000B5AA86B|nr:flagellar basal body rod protein FlgF [Porphyrobacter sp. CACIAM 03H1]ASJ90122.1 flagellar biosynthesis protein FlgF [Porphyrobacter sp. CACIAM 03H1]